MSESTTAAIAWAWDNDPDLRASASTPEGDALLIVQAAAPMRWGKNLMDGSDARRAARAVVDDEYYREAVFADAVARIDHMTGSYAVLGKRLCDARDRLNGRRP